MTLRPDLRATHQATLSAAALRWLTFVAAAACAAVVVYFSLELAHHLVLPGERIDPTRTKTTFVDFRDTVWTPGRELLAGGNPYDPRSYLLHHPGSQEFDLYAPAWLLLALPFSVLPYRVAAGCYVVALLVVVLLCARVLLRSLGWRRRIWAVLATAIFLAMIRPGRETFLGGQATFAMALGSWVALRFRAEHSWLAAVGLALALTKPQVGLPLAAVLVAMGFWRATWRGVAVLVAGSTPVLIACVLSSGGVSAFADSLSRNLQVSQRAPGTALGRQYPADRARIDLLGFLARATHVTPPNIVQLAVAVGVILICCIVTRRMRAVASVPATEAIITAIALLAVLLSFVHQHYDLLILILPASTVTLVAVRSAGCGRRWRPTLSFVLLAVLLWFPVLHVHSADRLLGPLAPSEDLSAALDRAALLLALLVALSIGLCLHRGTVARVCSSGFRRAQSTEESRV